MNQIRKNTQQIVLFMCLLGVLLADGAFAPGDMKRLYLRHLSRKEPNIRCVKTGLVFEAMCNVFENSDPSLSLGISQPDFKNFPYGFYQTPTRSIKSAHKVTTKQNSKELP
jgi:hypothetical protein